MAECHGQNIAGGFCLGADLIGQGYSGFFHSGIILLPAPVRAEYKGEQKTQDQEKNAEQTGFHVFGLLGRRAA